MTDKIKKKKNTAITFCTQLVPLPKAEVIIPWLMVGTKQEPSNL